MTTKQLFYNHLPALVLCATFLLCGCEKKAAPVAAPPIPVTVVTVERTDIPVTFEYVGVAESSHEVEVRARVTGYLEAIGYLEGSFVQKNDLLFQLDPRPFQAVLAENKALLANEQAILWQAQRAVSRFKPLYEQKAASQRDLDNALASEMSAEAQVLAAQAKVESAVINLDYTTMRSAVSGLAGQAKYRVGSLITEGQDLMTTVSVVDPIWVVFSVAEQDILRSDLDRSKGLLVFPPEDNFTIELILADQTVFNEKGRINFTSPVFSQKTGTMMVRAVLPNPGYILKPGQFVRVKLMGAIRPQGIQVPQQAVVQSKNGPLLFVVNSEEKAESRSVELGPWNGNNWIIASGLNNGDRVIVNGVNKVLPGSAVKVIPESSEQNSGEGASQQS
jgi:membrane fusion protein, multidrug efflux system